MTIAIALVSMAAATATTVAMASAVVNDGSGGDEGARNHVWEAE